MFPRFPRERDDIVMDDDSIVILLNFFSFGAAIYV